MPQFFCAFAALKINKGEWNQPNNTWGDNVNSKSKDENKETKIEYNALTVLL